MQVRPMKVMIGIPAYRNQVHNGHIFQTMSWYAALAKLRGAIAYGGLVSPTSCSVDWSRNIILWKALHAEFNKMGKGADWCLMFDSDTFTTDAMNIVAMLDEGQQRGAAVIAAPVAIRGKQAYNVLTRKAEGDAITEYTDEESWRGEVVEVDRIGTAFMAINCNWIKDHWPDQPWFAHEHLKGDTPAKIGEDIRFCDGVKDRGGMILCDGRFEPIHDGANVMEHT